jgi:hypothetical protein
MHLKILREKRKLLFYHKERERINKRGRKYRNIQEQPKTRSISKLGATALPVAPVTLFRVTSDGHNAKIVFWWTTHTHTHGDDAITMQALQRSVISPNIIILNAGGVVMQAFLSSIPPLRRANPFLYMDRMMDNRGSYSQSFYFLQELRHKRAHALAQCLRLHPPRLKIKL